jgi:hypothetical protein
MSFGRVHRREPKRRSGVCVCEGGGGFVKTFFGCREGGGPEEEEEEAGKVSIPLSSLGI